jgi:hypothetical protein
VREDLSLLMLKYYSRSDLLINLETRPAHTLGLSRIK